MVKLYLERAGHILPIDLWLDFKTIANVTVDVEPVISLILQNIHRCWSLTIRASIFHVSKIFPLTGDLSSLRDLELQLATPYHNPFRTVYLLKPSPEHHLRSLSIFGVPYLDLPNIQWGSLSHLALYEVCLPQVQILAVLRRCTNLISFKCKSDSLVRREPNDGVIELPHLKLLDVRLSGIFPPLVIRAPRLQHLRTQGYMHAANSSYAVFPLLRTIALDEFAGLSRNAVRTCLSLTALELVGSEKGLGILESLIPVPLALAASPEATEMLAPALAHIRVRRNPHSVPLIVWKTTSMLLKTILQQRPQVVLEYEATRGAIGGFKSLSTEFPGRVRAVDDFAAHPPLSDRFWIIVGG